MGANRAKLDAVLARAMPPPMLGGDPFGAMKPRARGKQDYGVMRPAWEGAAGPPPGRYVLREDPVAQPAPRYEDLGQLQREDEAQRAGERAAREYSPLPDELGWFVPPAAVAGDLIGASVDTGLGLFGDRSAQERNNARLGRWERGARQAGSDVLDSGHVGEAMDWLSSIPETMAAEDEALREQNLTPPTALERAGGLVRGLWAGWPEAGREARARAAGEDARAAYDAREGELAWAQVEADPWDEEALARSREAGLSSRMAEDRADRAYGDDFWITGPAAAEFAPGFGIVSGAGGLGRRILTGAPREVLHETPGALTREAVANRDWALGATGAGVAAEAADGDFGDDPLLSAVAGGSLAAVARNAPGAVRRLGQAAPQAEARASASRAASEIPFPEEATAPNLTRLEEGVFGEGPDAGAGLRRIEGPEGFIEYEVRPDGWHIRGVNVAEGGDGQALVTRFLQAADAEGAQVLAGQRHAPGSRRLGEMGSAPTSEWDGVFAPPRKPPSRRRGGQGGNADVPVDENANRLAGNDTPTETVHYWNRSRARNEIINGLREQLGVNEQGGAGRGRRSQGSAEHVAAILRGEQPLPDGSFVNPPHPEVTRSTVLGVWKRARDSDMADVARAAPETDEAAAARLGIPVERYRAISAQRRGAEAPLEEPRATPEPRRTDLPTTGYHATVARVDGPLIEGEGGLGRGAYHSTDPDIADWLITDDAGNYVEGANIVPERLPALSRYARFDDVQSRVARLAERRGVNPDDANAMLAIQDEVREALQREGYVGIRNDEYAGGAGELVTWDASNRRAPWARMSERNRDSSDPFAGVALTLGAGAGGAALFASDSAEAGDGGESGGMDWLPAAGGAGTLAALGALYALRRPRGTPRLGRGADTAAQLAREERIGHEALPHLTHLDEAERVEALNILRSVDEEGFDEALAILRGEGEARSARIDSPTSQADYEASIYQGAEDLGVDEFEAIAGPRNIDLDAPNARELFADEWLRNFPYEGAVNDHRAAASQASDAIWGLSPEARAQVADRLGVSPSQAAEAFTAPIPRGERLNSVAAPLAVGALGAGSAAALFGGGEAEAASGRDDGEPLTAMEAIERYGLASDYFNSDEWLTVPTDSVPSASGGRVVATDGEYFIVEMSGRLFKFHRFRDFDPSINAATVSDQLVGEVVPANRAHRFEPNTPPQDWLDSVSDGQSTLDDVSALERLGMSGVALLGSRTLLGRAPPVLRDIGAGLAAGSVDYALGGDADEAAVVGGLSALASRGGQSIDNAVADASANWARRLDPAWRAERDAFARTLSDEAPRVRGMRLQEDPFDHGVYGEVEGVRGLVPAEEMLEQGFARDFAPVELSPRQQFLQAPPVEQQVWLDSAARRAPSDWLVPDDRGRLAVSSREAVTPPPAAPEAPRDPFQGPRDYRVTPEDMIADPEGRGALLFNRAKGPSRAANELAAIADEFGVEVVRGPRGGVNGKRTGANLLRAINETGGESSPIMRVLRERGLLAAVLAAGAVASEAAQDPFAASP